MNEDFFFGLAVAMSMALSLTLLLSKNRKLGVAGTILMAITASLSLPMVLKAIAS